jgi:O-antigen/teichoic acid export membrane protein
MITAIELKIALKTVKFHWRFDLLLINKLWKFGAPLIPVTLLVWIMNSMDKVALRIWSDFDQIGLYAGRF